MNNSKKTDNTEGGGPVAVAAAADQATTTSAAASSAYCRMVSFFSLVGLAVSTQTAFKLSQRGGTYEYNTMSAMCIVELIKLLLSLVHYYKEHHHHHQHHPGKEQGNSSIADTLQGALRNLSPSLYVTYALLALSYAVYNQLIFAVMKVADPGTFSLLKSFTSFLVSLLNFILFGEALTQLQWFCVFIQIFGIIPVITTNECNNEDDEDTAKTTVQLSYAANVFLLMVFCCLMGSLNTVYNAAVVKKINVPVSLQNILLYSFGVLINTAFYFIYATANNNNKPFFYGYGHWGVWLLLILNSFVGIAITMIYKYGDAVLKTLTAPLSSAILVYISYLLFDMPLNIVKAAGAGVVVVDTLLYLKLPSIPPPAGDNATTEHNNRKSGRPVNSRAVMGLTLLFAAIGTHLIGSPTTAGFAPNSSSLLTVSAKNITTTTTADDPVATQMTRQPNDNNNEQELSQIASLRQRKIED